MHISANMSTAELRANLKKKNKIIKEKNKNMPTYTCKTIKTNAKNMVIKTGLIKEPKSKLIFGSLVGLGLDHTNGTGGVIHNLINIVKIIFIYYLKYIQNI